MNAAIATVLILGLSGGCSFVGVQGRKSATEPAGCTTSRMLPILDTLTAVPPVALAAVTVGEMIANDFPRENWATLFVPVFLGISLPWVVSAIYGYTVTGRCRRAQQVARLPH